MSNGRSVIVLEDEVISAMGLQSQLRRAGFETVYLATSFDAAMEIYRRHHPAIAIVDINLQNHRSGLDFIREAESLERVIILSGYDKRFYDEELRGLDYATFLEKPAHFSAIIRAISE